MTWGSRGDAEPLAVPAVKSRDLGAQVRVCAPPDEAFAALSALAARVGVRAAPLGPTVRSVVAGTKAPTARDAFRLAPEPVAARFDTLAAAAEGSDALPAAGLMPAGARDVVIDLAPIDERVDCFAVGEAGQQARQALVRRVAAVVHHGGAGATTTAARAGAPRVVVPRIADQPYRAGRPPWASARHTRARLRPSSPCPPRSRRP